MRHLGAIVAGLLGTLLCGVVADYHIYAAGGRKKWPRPSLHDLKEETYFPTSQREAKAKMETYQKFLDYAPQRMAKLQGLLEGMDPNQPVILMIINWGQTHLFFNWLCGLHEFGLTKALSQSLVFTGDQKTYDAVHSHVATYMVESGEIGNLVSEAAKVFGDGTFGRMMFLKLGSLYSLSVEMQRDVLYQDVDIVWNHDPTPLFYNTAYRDMDLLVSYDGNLNQPPFYGNAGFFFVRSNKKGQEFVKDWLKYFSKRNVNAVQDSMNRVLIHHYIVYGLDLQVLPTSVVPHPHDRRLRQGGDMGRALDGVSPLIIHAAWTHNHWDKVKKLHAVKRWWFNEQCHYYTDLRTNYSLEMRGCMEHINCDDWRSKTPKGL